MATYEIFKDAKGEYRFHLKADNGEKILSSESYKGKGGAETGINSVKNNATADKQYTKKTSSDGKFYFTLHAANHEVIGTSETYSSEENRDEGIADVKRLAPGAQTKDLT